MSLTEATVIFDGRVLMLGLLTYSVYSFLFEIELGIAVVGATTSGLELTTGP